MTPPPTCSRKKINEMRNQQRHKEEELRLDRSPYPATWSIMGKYDILSLFGLFGLLKSISLRSNTQTSPVTASNPVAAALPPSGKKKNNKQKLA